MNRITLILCVLFLFGCDNSSNKMKEKYALYKHIDNKTFTTWVLFDKHLGDVVQIMQLKKGINGDERGMIAAGYYIQDREASHWNFATFNRYSFETIYPSLKDAIKATDESWFSYRHKVEDDFTVKGETLILNCVNCYPEVIYEKADMP